MTTYQIENKTQLQNHILTQFKEWCLMGNLPKLFYSYYALEDVFFYIYIRYFYIKIYTNRDIDILNTCKWFCLKSTNGASPNIFYVDLHLVMLVQLLKGQRN